MSTQEKKGTVISRKLFNHGLTRRGHVADQLGHTLIETMIATAISMVVSVTAVGIMGSTTGTANDVLNRIRLSQDLRNTLTVVTRDVRRAGYTASAMWCLANTVCLPDATINLPIDASLPLLGSFELPGGFTINEDGDCITFELDRNQDGTVSDDEFSGYRYMELGGAGTVEMWLGSSPPDCEEESDHWIALTDGSNVNISLFSVDDDLSIDEIVAVDLLGNSTTNRTRRIRILLEGHLVTEPAFSERLEDTIDVRNDVLL
jgi:hypothetical protein